MAVAHVGGVEESSGEQVEVAHDGIILIGAGDRDVFLAPGDAHGVEAVHDAGRGDDARAKFIAHGVDIGLLDVVGVGLRGGTTYLPPSYCA